MLCSCFAQRLQSFLFHATIYTFFHTLSDFFRSDLMHLFFYFFMVIFLNLINLIRWISFVLSHEFIFFNFPVSFLYSSIGRNIVPQRYSRTALLSLHITCLSVSLFIYFPSSLAMLYSSPLNGTRCRTDLMNVNLCQSADPGVHVCGSQLANLSNEFFLLPQ